MQRILAVSDDQAYLTSLVEASHKHRMFQLVTAPLGWSALAEQRLRPSEVVLVDLQAGAWEAYQFLGELHKEFPNVPLMGLTLASEVALERRARQMGIVRMVNRSAPPKEVLDEVHFALEAAPQGHIEGLHLSSLLQVLHWERKNCRALVQNAQREGTLYFDRGLLIHAVQGDLSGQAAAQEILGWNQSRVEFLSHQASPRTIHLVLNELLMLVAQDRDEKDRDEMEESLPGISPREGTAPA